MNNFTPRAQQVLALSRKEADRFNHNYVSTEHLLLGLVRLGQGVAVNVLHKLGLDLEILRIEVEKLVGTGPDTKVPGGTIPYTPRIKKVLALAGKEAKALNHSYVGTEHILLGLLREGDGVAASVLKSLGVDMEQTRTEILSELDPNFSADPSASAPTDQEVNRVEKHMAAFEADQNVLIEGSTDTSSSTHQSPPSEHLILKPYLNAGETLLWSGTPRPKFRFSLKQIPLAFLVLIFGSFLLIPLSAVFKSDSSSNNSTTVAPSSSNQSPAKPASQDSMAGRIILVFWFGGIFTWVFYCWFGDPILSRLSLPKTAYGVTDQRVIVVINGKKKTVRSHFLHTTIDIHLELWPDGFGTISFGPTDKWPFARLGFFSQSAFLLEHISSAAKVFQIISQAATNKPASEPSRGPATAT